VKDPWEEILAANVAHIHKTADGYECAASAELLEHVLGVARGLQNSGHSRRLAQSMKHVGWMISRVTIHGKQVRGYIRPAVPTSGADIRGLMLLDTLRAIDEAIPRLSLEQNSPGYAGPAIAQAIAPHLGRIAPHLRKAEVGAQGAAMLQRLLNAGLVHSTGRHLALTPAGRNVLAGRPRQTDQIAARGLHS
jgi:hypothetical protein